MRGRTTTTGIPVYECYNLCIFQLPTIRCLPLDLASFLDAMLELVFPWISRSETYATPTRLECVAGIIQSIRERKHFDVLYVLLSENLQHQLIFQDCSNLVKEPFFHFMLKYQPPATLVELVMDKIEASGDFLNDIDALGRTPLHVAAAYGCDCEVIGSILRRNRGIQLAASLDKDERCPLHLMFTDTSERRSPIKELCQLQSVALLLKAFPQAAVTTDTDACTPLDLATNACVDKRIIQLLTTAAKKCLATPANANYAPDRVPSVISESERNDSDDLSSIGWDGEGSDDLDWGFESDSEEL